MRFLITLVFICYTLLSIGQSNNVVNIRSEYVDGDLTISLLSGEYFEDIVSSIVFTIRWCENVPNPGGFIMDSLITNSRLPYITITPSGLPFTVNSYTYQPFVGFGFNRINSEELMWKPNVKICLGKFNTTENCSYEITNDNVALENNTIYYISLNGYDVTGYVENYPCEIDVNDLINQEGDITVIYDISGSKLSIKNIRYLPTGVYLIQRGDIFQKMVKVN